MEDIKNGIMLIIGSCLIELFCLLYTNFDNYLTILFVFLIVQLIGIMLILSGLKKKYNDKKTDSKGEICYGYVSDIKIIDDYKNIEVSFVCYVNSKKEIKEMSEVFEYGIFKFIVGTFIKLKYYKKDINFIDVVKVDDVPVEIKDILQKNINERLKIEDNINALLDSNNAPKEIVINGITYERIDE